MTDELVAYLLDDVCPQRRAEIERRLETDAAWRGELERLRQCLASGNDVATCGGDGVDEPPRDLVRRTCCYVEHAGERVGHPATASAAVASPTFTPARVGLGGGNSWSLADVAVGGGVLVLLGMLVTPALRESRDATRRLVCQTNLQKIGAGVYEYQDGHGRWIPPVGPGHSAGEFAVALADHVGISRAELASWLVCPDSAAADELFSGQRRLVIPTQEQLDAARGDERAEMVRDLSGSYAYRAGYRDARGDYHYVKYTGSSDHPVLADAPEVVVSGARNVNHGGRGENVLSEDLGVRYMSNCQMAANLDNIHLNAAGEHAAGCSKDDMVLIRSDCGPEGPDGVLDAFDFGAFGR